MSDTTEIGRRLRRNSKMKPNLNGWKLLAGAAFVCISFVVLYAGITSESPYLVLVCWVALIMGLQLLLGTVVSAIASGCIGAVMFALAFLPTYPERSASYMSAAITGLVFGFALAAIVGFLFGLAIAVLSALSCQVGGLLCRYLGMTRADCARSANVDGGKERE